MLLIVAIPAAFPVVKATIVGLGTMALGAMALFFGKRRRVSESPRCPQPENSQTAAPASPAPTLIGRLRDGMAQASPRAGEVFRETVKAVEKARKVIANAAERIVCNITKASIARIISVAVLQLGMVQALEVDILLKAFLKSPPRTRAPSFAA
jgi:hypothetical protein